MNLIIGHRLKDGQTVVSLDGAELAIPPDFIKDPGQAFDWGYEGAGPMRLAEAILFAFFNDRRSAIYLAKLFCSQVLAKLPVEGFTLKNDAISSWVSKSVGQMRWERLIPKGTHGHTA